MIRAILGMGLSFDGNYPQSMLCSIRMLHIPRPNAWPKKLVKKRCSRQDKKNNEPQSSSFIQTARRVHRSRSHPIEFKLRIILHERNIQANRLLMYARKSRHETCPEALRYRHRSIQILPLALTTSPTAHSAKSKQRLSPKQRHTRYRNET